LALPQKMNLHSHMFRNALYSTSLRGSSFMWFWIYDLYPLPDFTPVCLVEPLYWKGVHGSWNVKAGDHVHNGQSWGHWAPQRGKHWRHLTKNGRLLSKDFHSLGSRPKITPSIGRCGGCPNCWFWRCYLQVSSYTNFSNLQFGAKASSWKHLATGEALIKQLWKGFSWIRLQWTRGDRKFPQVWGNMMLSWPRCESKARWKAPIKRKRKEKSEVGVGKIMPNEP
jgi:hypothetical protein